MKTFLLILMFVSATSCQVTETISINEDGSGTIIIDKIQDINFSERFNAMNKAVQEDAEVFVDTTYIFSDIIKKHSKTFYLATENDQKVFLKYSNVKVQTIKNSYTKESRQRISQNFSNTNQIADLYKTNEYISDIINNYALAAEEHYYALSYNFDGTVFNRVVKITSNDFHKKEIENIDNYMKQLMPYKPVQNYTLNYTFPRKIKSFSNKNAKISDDKTTLTLNFLLSDCLKKPEITNLEVVLE